MKLRYIQQLIYPIAIALGRPTVTRF